MAYKITYRARELKETISIPGSKSLSNRLLILKNLLNADIDIINLSTSNDTNVLLSALNNTNHIINVEDAGTSFRFLTAYLALKTKFPVILTGSDRMKERPISQLVDCLRQIGADIEYLDKEGYPAILIKPSELKGGDIYLNETLESSQYISALMMIGPFIKDGLRIKIHRDVSESYTMMTKSLMDSLGFKIKIIGQDEIIIKPIIPKILPKKWIVESDWSSASYWYSILIFSIGGQIKLNTFSENSIQGDSKIKIYLSDFIDSYFDNNSLIMQKVNPTYFGKMKLKKYEDWNLIIEQMYDLEDTPDLAQTLITIYTALGIKTHLKGLKTLKIKECDRLSALKSELDKLGIKISINEDSIVTESINLSYNNETINTFKDHRMIMSFIPFAMILEDGIIIDDISNVKKSYPTFIDDIKKVGFSIQEI